MFIFESTYSKIISLCVPLGAVSTFESLSMVDIWIDVLTHMLFQISPLRKSLVAPFTSVRLQRIMNFHMIEKVRRSFSHEVAFFHSSFVKANIFHLKAIKRSYGFKIVIFQHFEAVLIILLIVYF